MNYIVNKISYLEGFKNILNEIINIIIGAINILIGIINIASEFLKDLIDLVSFFLFNHIGVVGVFITILAMLLAYLIFRKTFRPVLQMEVLEQYTPLKKQIFYNLHLKNVGVVPAKDIKYEISNKNSEKRLSLFFNSKFKKDAFGDDIIKIKNRLSNDFDFIGSGSEYSGLFFSIFEDSKEIDFPFNSRKDKQSTESIIIEITYKNGIDNYRYKQEIVFSMHSYKELLTGNKVGESYKEHITRSLDEINKKLKGN